MQKKLFRLVCQSEHIHFTDVSNMYIMSSTSLILSNSEVHMNDAIPIYLLLEIPKFRESVILHDFMCIRTVGNPTSAKRCKLLWSHRIQLTKYAACVKKDDQIVGYNESWRSGRLAKTIFYSLRSDALISCICKVTGKAVNLGDGLGQKVPCNLFISGGDQWIKKLQ